MTSAGSAAAAEVATMETATWFSLVRSYFADPASFTLSRTAKARVTSTEAQTTSETFLYLAYGSNLNAATFRGRRNVRPLSAINVVVPELEVVFDLPGLPYTEPAFANSRFRKSKDAPDNEKTTLLGNASNPNGNATASALGWNKGLVGTVYEVTAEDYKHIIATEGGGSTYADILVDCYPLNIDEDTVPEAPSTDSFKAHTLFANKPARARKRRDGWAEASARYLGLITSGAEENKLPLEYRQWLNQLRPYTVTTIGQKFGRAFYMTVFVPWIVLLFQLQARLADQDGRGPTWLRIFTDRLFYMVWFTYDHGIKRTFGDGERTVGDEVPAHPVRDKVVI